MGASDLILGAETDWLGGEFFAPASTDLVDGLMGQYRSMRGKCLLPGWNHTWTEIYSGEFVGTGVSVSILVAEAP